MRKIKINRNGEVEIHHDDVQHFDQGGTALGGPGNGGVQNTATNPNTGFLGTINNAVGLNNQFQAGAANTQAGTNAAQLNQAYTGANNTLGQQQNFVNALQGQGGLGNQASVYYQQQQLANALQNRANGQGPNPAQAALNQATGQNVANQAALMAGQRGAGSNVGLLARQAAQQGAATQQQAVGQGATLQAQQEIAAQEALANQQAQMQGVAANQIAAQGQNLNTLSQAQQNEQNILQNSNTSFNNAQVGMQENLNNVNAATSAANQNMAGNTFGGILKGASALSSLFAKGGMVPHGMYKSNPKIAKVKPKDRLPIPDHIKGMAMLYHPHKFAEGGEAVDDSAEDKSNAPEAATPATEAAPVEAPKADAPPSEPSSFSGAGPHNDSSASNGPGGGAPVSLPADQTNFADAIQAPSSVMGGGSGGGGGASGIAAIAAMAKGGRVYKMAGGGDINFSGTWNPMSSSASAGPGGGAAPVLPAATTDFSKDIQTGQKKDPGMKTTQGPTMAGGAGDTSDSSFVSPGAELGDAGETAVAATGGKIPGKPKVNKDSYKNDTVKALLSPGEVVIPLHVMKSDDPVGNSAKFVAAILAQHGKQKGNETDDFKKALKQAISSRKGK